MKITKQRLKQIIREEIEKVPSGPRPRDHVLMRNSMAKSLGISDSGDDAFYIYMSSKQVAAALERLRKKFGVKQ
jgi:hypothetical protein